VIVGIRFKARSLLILWGLNEKQSVGTEALLAFYERTNWIREMLKHIEEGDYIQAMRGNGLVLNRAFQNFDPE